MGLHIRALQRLGLFVAVWAAAIFMCGQAWQAYQENIEVRSRLERNEQEYNSKLAELTRLLEAQQRLASDRDTQVALLKQKLGYCEPGEIPIVIVDKSSGSSI